MEMIFAVAANGVIGAGNRLPWPHLPEDMLYFRRITHGKTVVMGNKTWESLPTRPLPDRRNLVVRSAPILPHEITITDIPANSIIIGGARLYHATAHLCHRAYVTHIEAAFTGDTFLDIGHVLSGMAEIDSRTVVGDNGVKMRFATYERT